MSAYFCTGLSKKDVPPILMGDVVRSDVRFEPDATKLRIPTSDGIAAVWAVDPRETKVPPVAIILGGTYEGHAETRELIAWLWTYSAEIRPITAVTRIFGGDAFQVSLLSSDRPTLGNVSNAWIGAMLGETLLYAEERAVTTRPGANAALGSCTFVQARAVALGYQGLSDEFFSSLWSTARIVTRQAGLPGAGGEFSVVWQALRHLSFGDNGPSRVAKKEVDPDLVRSLAQFSEQQSLSSDTLFMLSDGQFGRSGSLFRERVSREDLVRDFQESLRLAYESKVKSEGLALALAYQLNLIGQGAMDHSALLSGLRREMPSAYLWYGVLAGMTKSGSSRLAFEGVGRRVLRELLRTESPLEYPQTDIDLVELEVAVESARWDQMRGTLGSVLSVNLFPGISTSIRLRYEEKHAVEGVAQYESDELADREQVARDLRTLDLALIEARAGVERLTKSLRAERSSPNRTTRSAKRK